jgi:hypothetical protein
VWHHLVGILALVVLLLSPTYDLTVTVVPSIEEVHVAKSWMPYPSMEDEINGYLKYPPGRLFHKVSR